MARAIWNGEVIAESDNTEIVEGNHYFPFEAVKAEYLRESEFRTACHWKGTASYYDLVVHGKLNENAAWFYPAPSTAARNFEGRVAFWHGVKVEA